MHNNQTAEKRPARTKTNPVKPIDFETRKIHRNVSDFEDDSINKVLNLIPKYLVSRNKIKWEKISIARFLVFATADNKDEEALWQAINTLIQEKYLDLSPTGKIRPTTKLIKMYSRARSIR